MATEPMTSMFTEQVARRWPASTLGEKPDGSFVITIPEFPLAAGMYNQQQTRMWFVVPVGFPQACPENFWTDAALRLRSGGVPSHTWPTPAGVSWVHRLLFWDPQRDSLVNYVGSITRRLTNPFPAER